MDETIMLDVVEEYTNKRDNIEKTICDYLTKQFFGKLPEDEKLGKRIRVTIKDIKTYDALGPFRGVTFCGFSDLVKSYTREVSVDLNLVFVYEGKPNINA